MGEHVSIKPDILRIGAVTIPNRAFLAPMAGITDAPFRSLAHRLGAGLVVSEMVASRHLAEARDDMLRRASNRAHRPFAIQLAGREAFWMREGARVAQDMGADLIDINMGCPAKQVTRGASGAALMRDPDHALQLIDAVVSVARVPVTLKMRLGWDDSNRNASEIAVRAQNAGVSMITVHGRTRAQFYNGKADWSAIAQVKQAVAIPIVANGDIRTTHDALSCLKLSGADAVMIGRGAQGCPWLPGQIGQFLKTGQVSDDPDLQARKVIALEHYEAMLCHYGIELGRRVARKHLGWQVEANVTNPQERAVWRARLCREESPPRVMRTLSALYDGMPATMAYTSTSGVGQRQS